MKEIGSFKHLPYPSAIGVPAYSITV